MYMMSILITLGSPDNISWGFTTFFVSCKVQFQFSLNIQFEYSVKKLQIIKRG